MSRTRTAVLFAAILVLLWPTQAQARVRHDDLPWGFLGEPLSVASEAPTEAVEPSIPFTRFPVQTTPEPTETRSVNSTAYCPGDGSGSTMASGNTVHDGAVAMNGVAFGTRWRILSGPLTGKVVTVEDRYGWGTEFDVWMPGSECFAYGRHRIVIERVE